MVKINLGKVEGALSDTLHKMQVQELITLADQASGKDPVQVAGKERLPIVLLFKIELKRLQRQDKPALKKLGLKKKNLEHLMSHPESLSAEDWADLLQAKNKVETYLKQLPQDSETDEDLVEKERHKHINKRFNVNDRWLPLT